LFLSGLAVSLDSGNLISGILKLCIKFKLLELKIIHGSILWPGLQEPAGTAVCLVPATIGTGEPAVWREPACRLMFNFSLGEYNAHLEEC
jgi:hypothetical protein